MGGRPRSHGKDAVGADEGGGHEEGGGQAVLGQDAGGEEVVAVAVVEGDGHGARRHGAAGSERVEDLGQRHDAESAAQHAADRPEAGGARRSVRPRGLRP